MLDTLTLGDLADIEDVTGMSLNGVNLDSPPMKFALALYWVSLRKSNPKFTYADARNTPIAELSAFRDALAGNPTAAVPPKTAEAANADAAEASPITAG